MELILNLAWTMLTVLMVWLWLHYAAQTGVNRRTQFVALAIVILLLFPVISVTDDLMLAQNPAETDRSQRKVQLCANGHSVHFSSAELPSPFTAEPSLDTSRFAALGDLLAPVIKVPAKGSIQNRPPPAA